MANLIYFKIIIISTETRLFRTAVDIYDFYTDAECGDMDGET